MSPTTLNTDELKKKNHIEQHSCLWTAFTSIQHHPSTIHLLRCQPDLKMSALPQNVSLTFHSYQQIQQMSQNDTKKCVIKEVLLSIKHTHNNNDNTDSSDLWEPTANFLNNYAAVATERCNATTIKEDGAVSQALRSILQGHTRPQVSLWDQSNHNNSIMDFLPKNKRIQAPKHTPSSNETMYTGCKHLKVIKGGETFTSLQSRSCIEEPSSRIYSP